MKPLDANRVATIAEYLRGKRREKFLASVEVINTSVAQGAWIKRGSQKADAGFYSGLPPFNAGNVADHKLDMCLRFGKPYAGEVSLVSLLLSRTGRPEAEALAWVALCNEKAAVCAELDAARPLPTITAIGLSPKVTKTLTACNLDLELSSIALAKIAFYEQPMIVVAKDSAVYCAIDREGRRVLEKVYYPDWTPGIKHGLSRCAGKADACEACGRYIPSGRFVPIEATCRRHGLVSLWVGCDCARNIFGIKDVGVTRAAETAQKG